MVNTAQSSARNNINTQQSTASENKKWYLNGEGELLEAQPFHNGVPVILHEIGQSPDTEYYANIKTGKIYTKKPENISSNDIILLKKEKLGESLEKAFAKQQEIKEEGKKKNIEETREKTKKEQSDELDSLMKKLNGLEESNKDLEEIIQKLKEDSQKNREENTKKLEELMDAKRRGNPDRIKNLKNIIRNLKKEKAELQKKYENTPKYNEGQIGTLTTKWIDFELIQKRTINGRVERNLGSVSIVRNLRSRRRLNKTIRKLNEIKDDSKRGVKYIMSKTRKRGGGKLGAWLKRGYNSLTIRDTDKFDKVFNAQKKFFIDDLESKIKANYSTEAEFLASNNGKSIQAIKKRINYYQQDYKKKMITV